MNSILSRLMSEDGTAEVSDPIDMMYFDEPLASPGEAASLLA